MAELPAALLRGGERWRAPYAADPRACRGRVHPEAEDPLRSPFQRDRDRVIHSNAFRRLKHKTQVFIHHEGDHFRTRLTHTLEVAQVARSIARPLGLDEDLAEALALAHDLGHPPFGHAGERILDHALAEFGGFDHNAQTLRVVTALERRYPRFDGLNLTWESLEGIAKHNGPLTDPSARLLEGRRELAEEMSRLPASFDLDVSRFASLEAQVASLSDDIAYASHDLEDGLRAGLLHVAKLHDQPLVGPILREIRAEHPSLEPPRMQHEVVRRIITVLIADVIGEAERAINAAEIRSPEAVRMAGRPLIRFSPAMAEAEAGLKAFLFENLYRHPAVMEPVRLAEAVVSDLIQTFTADPSLMPPQWRPDDSGPGGAGPARRVADYIAGMTDRYAIAEHRRLFDRTPDLG
jgi:dGTPase